ncbi:MAG: hypothetical protein R3300_08795 [Candidatus Promineifilaceae bacterium]|nr:hypothetical protein [Candidatus Promineifilaceae bacterium]
MNAQTQTLTFTARSTKEPEKIATFTLQNGSVKVQLGDALIEQAEKATDEQEDSPVRAWAKPAATASLQRLMQPIPVADFDANFEDDALTTTAWVRAGGLRLAPVRLTWEQVDNPDGAVAFVKELQSRREAHVGDETGVPNPFDYWAGWFLAIAAGLVTTIVVGRLIKQRRSES